MSSWTATDRSYQFRSVWNLTAPPERCWNELLRRQSWRRWWPALRGSAGRSTAQDGQWPGQALDVGSVVPLTVRSPLGYHLRVRLTVTQWRPPHWLAVVSDGDLAGSGYASFTETTKPWSGNGTAARPQTAVGPQTGVRVSAGTQLRIVWRVSTRLAWMNRIAPVAAPVFRAAHAAVMWQGRRHFAEYLARECPTPGQRCTR